jgi:glycosyltransferase involved in cell wall biosynthesis
VSADLAILVPVLNRPHRVMPLLESIKAATPDALVVFLSDPSDGREHAALAGVPWAGAPAALIDSEGGNYAEKINRGVELTDTTYIFTGADDLDFHPGWFEAAVAQMTDEIGCVGTQDLCNRRVVRGEHATHFLLARWYAEQSCIDGSPGPLFEGYEHEFVDDELIGTARKRDVYAFAGDAVVEHLHPDVGKAPTDRLYQAQGERMARSRPLFEERRELWT